MRKKILVVNKDENLSQGIRMNLEELADVIALGSTENLDSAVREKGIDCILMDSDFLDEAGLNVLSLLKKNNPGLGLVVMQLYGEEPPAAAKARLDIVDMFVYKPIDFDILTQRLNLFIPRIS